LGDPGTPRAITLAPTKGSPCGPDMSGKPGPLLLEGLVDLSGMTLFVTVAPT